MDNRDTYMDRIITRIECCNVSDDCILWKLYFDDDVGGTVHVEYVGNDRNFKVGDVISLGVFINDIDDACLCLLD